MQNFNAENCADNCMEHDDETLGNVHDLFEILKIDSKLIFVRKIFDVLRVFGLKIFL